MDLKREKKYSPATSLGLLVPALVVAIATALAAAPALAQNTNPTGNGANALKNLQNMFKAANANGNGNGNGNQFCAIVVTQGGQLRASPDNMTLSSQIMGGQAGTAEVVATNGAYSLSIDQNAGFSTQPAGGSANTTFSSTFSATGATNFADTPGQIPQKIKQGTTQVETNFIATRTNDPFPAGNYTGELVLRCE